MRMRKIFFINLYIPNSIDWTQESCYFENQDSILANSFELDQTLSFESLIDILTSYPFLEIEFEHEYDHEPQLSNSISLPDFIMIRCFYQISDFFLSQHWILCQSIVKLNHQSFMIIILNLTNFILLKVPLIN